MPTGRQKKAGSQEASQGGQFQARIRNVDAGDNRDLARFWTAINRRRFCCCNPHSSPGPHIFFELAPSALSSVRVFI